MIDFAENHRTADSEPQGTPPSGPIGLVVRLHDGFFSMVHRATAGWFLGFSARFVFASVLLIYYLNSGWQKLGDGFFGFLNPSIGAFASILPPVMEQYGFDVTAIPWFPWHLVVIMGTLGEILLPIAILIGLFSRIAAIGMIIFVFVQSYVDIAYHGLEGKFIGSMFDRFQDAIIFDQRLLWIFPLVIIIVAGPGKLSVDHLLKRWFYSR